MGKILVMDHPLIQHKLSIIRNIETGSKEFRELISRLLIEFGKDTKFGDVNIFADINPESIL